jgi:hypothetical protein
VAATRPKKRQSQNRCTSLNPAVPASRSNFHALFSLVLTSNEREGCFFSEASPCQQSVQPIEGKTYRGERINAEDVNMAAGEHDPSKRDELKRDTIEERDRLEQALRVIQDFCLENKVNCFLVQRDSESRGQVLLGELVDLRFVHVVESRTSVRDQPGKLYTGYMLDISQYTGERRRRELQMIEFWKRDEIDRIRRSKYVLDLTSLENDSADTPSTTQ